MRKRASSTGRIVKDYGDFRYIQGGYFAEFDDDSINKM